MSAEVNGRFAHGLHCVGVKEHAALLGHFGHGLNGIDVAHLVVGEHDGHQGRVVGQGGGVFVQVQAALAVHAEQGHVITLAFPVLDHIEHRRMLHAGGDQVALFRLGLESGPDGRIVAFRAAGGENDLIRVGPQQGGHAFAGRIHGLAHLAAEAVHA